MVDSVGVRSNKFCNHCCQVAVLLIFFFSQKGTFVSGYLSSSNNKESWDHGESESYVRCMGWKISSLLQKTNQSHYDMSHTIKEGNINQWITLFYPGQFSSVFIELWLSKKISWSFSVWCVPDFNYHKMCECDGKTIMYTPALVFKISYWIFSMISLLKWVILITHTTSFLLHTSSSPQLTPEKLWLYNQQEMKHTLLEKYLL